VHEVRLPLRWRDMDAYGHVNNAVYLNFLEEARDAWVEEVLGPVAEDVWHFVLARVAIDFRSELKQADGEIVRSCRDFGSYRLLATSEEPVGEGSARVDVDGEPHTYPPEGNDVRRETPSPAYIATVRYVHEQISSTVGGWSQDASRGRLVDPQDRPSVCGVTPDGVEGAGCFR
jgi:acyl-CoA thioester hydrolase